MDFESYLGMTPEEQYALFLKYEDPMDFIKWLEAEKAAYDQQQTTIVVGKGESVYLDG